MSEQQVSENSKFQIEGLQITSSDVIFLAWKNPISIVQSGWSKKFISLNRGNRIYLLLLLY